MQPSSASPSYIIPEQSKKRKLYSLLALIALGQIASLSYSCFESVNKILRNNGLRMESMTILLTSLVTVCLLCSQCAMIPAEIKPPNCMLFISALLKTAYSYLVMLAYLYTTQTSNDLIQALTILTVAALSMGLIKVKYRWTHYLAMLISVGGMFASLSSELFNSDQSFTSSSLLGDLFAFIAMLLSSIDLVIQEKLLREGIPLFAYVAHVSKYAIVFSLIIFCSTFQFKVFVQFSGKWLYLFFQIPLVALKFSNLIVIVLFINIYGAAFFSLIYLSTMLYSMLFNIFLFQASFRVYVVISFVLVIGSVVLYNLKDQKRAQEQHRELIELNMEEVQGAPPPDIIE